MDDHDDDDEIFPKFTLCISLVFSSCLPSVERSAFLFYHKLYACRPICRIGLDFLFLILSLFPFTELILIFFSPFFHFSQAGSSGVSDPRTEHLPLGPDQDMRLELLNAIALMTQARAVCMQMTGG